MSDLADRCPAFIYTRLSEARSIRLLTLLPGTDDSQAPLQCLLNEVSLDNEPDYEALSYTWATEDGDRSASEQVIVNECSIFITRNCDAALRRIRLPDEPRIVWVDAICIDQGDVGEVNQQVAMMGDIYRDTWQTLVWLGQGSEHTHNAFTWLDNYAVTKSCSMHWKHDHGRAARWYFHHDLLEVAEELSMSPVQLQQLRTQRLSGSEWDALAETYGPIIHSKTCAFGNKCSSIVTDLEEYLHQQNLGSTPRWSALKEIFHFQWWRRIWVLQEIALPTRVLIYFGRYQTDYGRLTSFLPKELRLEIAAGHRINAHQYFRKLIQGEEPYLGMTPMPDPFEIFTVAQASLATNPRDKIFGILGLFRHIDRERALMPLPDYTKSVAAVFTDVACRLVEYSGQENLILGCTGEVNEHQLPSWVPDWSQPPRWMWNGRFSASTLNEPDSKSMKYRYDGQVKISVGRKKPQVSVKDSVLRVFARPFCTVNKLWKTCDAVNFLDESWCQLYLTWFRLAQSQAGPLGEISADNIFSGMVSAGERESFIDLPPEDDDYPQDFEADCRAWISLLIQTEVHDITPSIRACDKASRIQKWSVAKTVGRVACLTDTGHVGLVPQATNAQDVVVNIQQSNMPYILRSGDQYKAIGACYLFGAMHQEGPMIGDAEFTWMTIR